MDNNSAKTPSWQQKPAQKPTDNGSEMFSDRLVESDIDGMSYEELMRYLENSGSDILNQPPNSADGGAASESPDKAQPEDAGQSAAGQAEAYEEELSEEEEFYTDNGQEAPDKDAEEPYGEADDSDDDGEGCDAEGFDREGCDREGFDREGCDREGFDREGYDREGFDREGYDREGFDREGYDREGFDRDNYDREGYDWYGFDCEGFDRGGFDHDGYDPEGYTREDWEAAGYSFNERGEFIMDEEEEADGGGNDDEAELEKEGGGTDEAAESEGEAEAETDPENEYPQGSQTEGVGEEQSAEAQETEEAENSASAGEEEYYAEDEFDEEGYDAEGYDCDGFDREGFDREGFDRDNYDREGYDWYGYNSEGFDRGGFDRDGYDAEGYTRADWEEAGYSFNERGEFIMDEENEQEEADGGENEGEAEYAEEAEETPEEEETYDYSEDEAEETEQPAEAQSPAPSQSRPAAPADRQSEVNAEAQDAAGQDEPEAAAEEISGEEEGSLDDLPPFELAPSPVMKTVKPQRQIPVKGVVPPLKGQSAAPAAAPAAAAEEPSEPVKDKNDLPVPDVPLYTPESFGTATFAWQYRCDYSIIYESGSQRGKEITLLASEMGKERTLTVGSPGLRANDIEVNEPGIANDQALIRYTSGRFYLINFQKDIKVNELVLESGEQAPLMSGDLIILGETVLRFRERSANEVLNTYSLEIIESNDHDMVGKSFALTKKRNTLGRDRNSDIVLADPEVSRSHCILNNRAGKFFLQHRSETNPTFINGISVTAGGERQINPGDKIQVSSRTILQFKKN